MMSFDCLIHQPTHFIQIFDGVHTHSYGPLITNGYTELVLNTLSDDMIYSLVIWDENVGGLSNIINKTISKLLLKLKYIY